MIAKMVAITNLKIVIIVIASMDDTMTKVAIIDANCIHHYIDRDGFQQ